MDSSGVFLPLQEDVFPDQDDFGRVFRNNAVMSSLGIPQITAIMGMCVAGGAYLPVMTDTVLMTEGSGLFLAGPALVQAAIGQKTGAEELGRRGDACGDIGDRGLQGAERSIVHRAAAVAGGEDGRAAGNAASFSRGGLMTRRTGCAAVCGRGLYGLIDPDSGEAATMSMTCAM